MDGLDGGIESVIGLIMGLEGLIIEEGIRGEMESMGLDGLVEEMVGF
jgi:hypothetical protein